MKSKFYFIRKITITLILNSIILLVMLSLNCVAQEDSLESSRICCDYIRFSNEITSDCCLKLNISNPYCFADILFQILNDDNQFETKQMSQDTGYFSFIYCANNTEKNVTYRVLITRDGYHNSPHCLRQNDNFDEFDEGYTMFTGTVDLSDCCPCPQDKDNWLKVIVNKDRTCSNNGCRVTLAKLDIPDTINCYTYYRVKLGTSLFGARNIINSPINNSYRFCLAGGASRTIQIYLLKNQYDPIDSACVITKTVSCTNDAPDPDSIHQPCTIDCPDSLWKPTSIQLVTLPNGCKIRVFYTYRTSCPPLNYQDLQIQSIEYMPCTFGLSAIDIYQACLKDLVEKNPMGFYPKIGSKGCNNFWRIIQSSCWTDIVDVIDWGGPVLPPDPNDPIYNPLDPNAVNLIPFYPIGNPILWRVIHKPCDSSICCMQQFRVCRDSVDHITMEPYGTAIYPPDPPCIYKENAVLPLDPFLSPSICYTTCNWLNFTYNNLKTSPELENNNVMVNNDFIINCDTKIECSVKIEFCNLQGEIVHIYKSKLNKGNNIIDLYKLVELQGIYLYRVYINDELSKTGKIIK